MELWLDLLFGNFMGLLTMGVIGFMLLMGVFFAYVFIAKSKEEPSSNH